MTQCGYEETKGEPCQVLVTGAVPVTNGYCARHRDYAKCRIGFTPTPGWLNRQFKRVEADIAQWPECFLKLASFPRPTRPTRKKSATHLGTYRQLLNILAEQCGQRGDSEGAAETLQRIIRERDYAVSIKTTLLDELDKPFSDRLHIHRVDLSMAESKGDQ